MQIVYTYCNINGKDLSEFEMKMNLLSVCSAKKFSKSQCVIYTDSPDFFKHLPFDKIYETDFFDWNWDHRYWNIPKMKTYTMQTGPFLHIDLDCILFPSFRYPSSQILTERIRSYSTDENCLKHIYKDLHLTGKVICSGLLGITDFSCKHIFDMMYEKAKSECVETSETVKFSDLYSIEEVSNAQVIYHNNYSISEIPCNMVQHFAGKNKEFRLNSVIDKLIDNFGFTNYLTK